MIVPVIAIFLQASVLPGPQNLPPLDLNVTFHQSQKHSHNCQLGMTTKRSTNQLNKSTDMGTFFYLPVSGVPDQDYFITNYVDQNRPGAGITDYSGGTWSYNNHLGTDFALRSFREMDEGVPVLSAAAGTIIFVQDGFDDRNIEMDPEKIGEVNLVGIQHEDGSEAWYAHFRKNSIRVRVGEEVTALSELGLVGSSGYSNGPHLHFEPQYPHNSPVDPFHSAPSNGWWATGQQLPYAGIPGRLKIVDAGIANKSSYLQPVNFKGGGSDIFIPMKEGLTQPVQLADSWNGAVIGPDTVLIWWNYQGTPTVPYRLMIEYDWSGSGNWTTWNYGDFQTTYQTQGEYGWVWLGIPSGPAAWRLRWQNLLTSAVLKTVPFYVGSQTQFKPRPLPAGKSFQTGTTITDQIQLLNYAYQLPISYSLDFNAPDGVSVSSSGLVTIPGSVLPQYRSIDFNVLITDGVGRKDTMHYNLIRSLEQDLSLPLTMKYFKVFRSGKYLNFRWETASEVNNLGFMIQRFNQIGEWETLADLSDPGLQGLGTSAFGKPYDYSRPINDLETGNRFRIGSVDFDGSLHWLKEAVIEGPEKITVSQPWPNPANPSFSLSVRSRGVTQADIRIADMLGRVVLSEKRDILPGEDVLTFKTDSFASGMYVISVNHDIQRKITVLK